jgi:hypothetical protein
MKRRKPTDDFYEPAQSGVMKKTVTIKAGSGKAVGLGEYEVSVESPEVQVSFQPDVHDDIGVSYEKLDIPGQGKYLLLYQFHNFSQMTCRITMRLSAVGHSS